MSKKKLITCKHCGKEGEHGGRGLCGKCYSKLQNQGKLKEYPRSTQPYKSKVCKVEGCDNEIQAFGYCHKHYIQITTYGYIKKRTVADPNEIIINKELNCAEILLYNIESEEVGRALIDIEDIEKVKQYKWHMNSNNYVSSTSINNKHLTLHRFIMNVYEEDYNNNIIDHINHNPLDNRKSNLRIANNKENARNSSLSTQNTSGIIGISYYKKDDKWQAYIRVDYKLIKLGLFKDKEEAIKMRLAAELKYFGKDFSPQRHLFEEYGINEDSTFIVKELSDIKSTGKSGVFGVRYVEKIKKWKVETKINGVYYYLGQFKEFEDAVRAKLLHELEHYGKEKAPQRNLFEKYNIS